MNKLFALFIIIPSFSLQAQVTFEKKIGGAGYQDGSIIASTHDGGFVIAGIQNGDTLNYSDIYILRVDSMGDSLWTKHWGAPGSNDFPSAIVETSDGGFLVSTTTYSLSSQAPTYSDWWILRLDASGDTLWTKMIRKPGNDRMMCISENDDQSILCCGWWSMNGYAVGTMLKLTSTGDSLWAVHIPSTGNSYAQFCMQDQNGNYLVAGSALSGTFYGLVYEYDTSGQFLSLHTYDLPGTVEIINSVHHLPQGGYLLSAKTGTLNGYDIWLLRVTEQWDTVWTRTFNDPIYLYDTEAKFAFDAVADSGCIFGGSKFTGLSSEAVIYRVDSSGNLEWTKFFGGSSPGEDKANSILSLSDGGFIFSGQADLVTNLEAEVYLVRADGNGDVSGTTQIPAYSNNDDLIFYPNPANESINWKIPEGKNSKLRVYTTSGILVKDLTLFSDSGMLYLQEFSPGMYVLEVIKEESIYRTQLIVLRH